MICQIIHVVDGHLHKCKEAFARRRGSRAQGYPHQSTVQRTRPTSASITLDTVWQQQLGAAAKTVPQHAPGG